MNTYRMDNTEGYTQQQLNAFNEQFEQWWNASTQGYTDEEKEAIRKDAEEEFFNYEMC